MAVLVIAEHDNATIKPATLNTVAAASRLGTDVTVLVIGAGCGPAAEAAARIAGVAKVLVADAAHLGDQLAENVAAQILAVAGNYTHLLAPATATDLGFIRRSEDFPIFCAASDKLHS